MKKNVLITGGCGFVGANLADYLLERGFGVTCFDNLSRSGSEILRKNITRKGGMFVHGDIRALEDLNRLSSGYDVMVECSAEPSVLVGAQGADAHFMVRNNLVGSLNCFEWARTRSCGVVFLSTSRVYPYDYLSSAHFVEHENRYEYCDNKAGLSVNGVSVDCPLKGVRSLYGATKLSGEYVLGEYAKNYSMPAVINRCGVLAGPWQLGRSDQGVFTFWLARHYFQKPLKYIGFGGKGKQVRDLLHIADLCDLLGKQIDGLDDLHGDVFNVGGGRDVSLSLRETTEICESLTGNRVCAEGSTEERPADLCWYVTDNGTTLERFNWAPKRSAHDILRDTYDWLRKHEVEFASVFR